MADVFLVKLETTLEQGLDQLLEALGGLARFVRPGDRVVLKPNLVAPFPAAVTDLRIILHLVERIRDLGAAPVVAEASGYEFDTEATFSLLGLTAASQRLGFPLLRLDQERYVRRRTDHRLLGELEISESVLEADFVINLPRLKMHSVTDVTLSMKNLFGCLSRTSRCRAHALALDDAIYWTHRLIRPSLTVADALQTLERAVFSETHRHNALLASVDGVSLDRVACDLLGMDYRSVPYIARAASEQSESATARPVNANIEVFRFPVHPSRLKTLPFKVAYRAMYGAELARGPCEQRRSWIPLFHWYAGIRPVMIPDRCTDCGKCIEVCPVDAIELARKRVNRERCMVVRCLHCVDVCPEQAIILRGNKAPRQPHQSTAAAPTRHGNGKPQAPEISQQPEQTMSLNNTTKIVFWKNKIWESRKLNIGEEAIFRSIIHAVRERIPNSEITVFSDDPVYLEQKYGIRSISIHSFREMWQALRDTDLIVMSGGTVFTDKSSLPIIPLNLVVPAMAKMLNKPVVAYGVGCGEVSPFGAFLMRQIVNKFEAITVRDEDSKTLLEDLGIRIPIRFTADPTFVLKADTDERARELLREEGIDPERQEPLVAIAPRKPFHYSHSILPFAVRRSLGLLPEKFHERLDEFTTFLARAADLLVNEYGARVVFVPMYQPAPGLQKGRAARVREYFSSRDDEIARAVIDRMSASRDKVHLVSGFWNSQELLAVMRRVDLWIGVPLHSLILASNVNTPIVGISYQSKVRRYMKLLGQEHHVINVEALDNEFSLEMLRRSIDSVWSDREAARKSLREHVEVFRDKAWSNIDVLRDVLARNR